MGKETICIVLVLALFLSITSMEASQSSANPARDMPESVEAGKDFTVTVTWTAPADDFNSIGLTDNANATTNMAVSGDIGWCSPNANNVNPVNNTIEYLWFGPYINGTNFTAVYSVHVPIGVPDGNYTFDGNLMYYIGEDGPYAEDIAGNSVIATEKPKAIFDTGSPATPYPSIMGNHTGTIKSNHTVIATKMYTYPCLGTGGHTEYARIWNDTWAGKEAYWKGYQGDWQNITFDDPFTLFAKKTYKYEIRTGSYPQIIHKPEHTTVDGSFINCTKFTDANGKIYTDWIPAIKLE